MVRSSFIFRPERVCVSELICRPAEAATVARELQADVCWMTERPLRVGGRYVLKHTSRSATAIASAQIGASGTIV